MEPKNADTNMSQGEVGKVCDNMDDDKNQVSVKAGDFDKNRKLVNIEAYYEETKKQMTDVLKRSTTERDKIKNELKKLKEDNQRYRNELEACERRSRERPPIEVISDSEMEEPERITRVAPKVLEELQKDRERFVSNLEALDTATKMIDKMNEESKGKLQCRRDEMKAATQTEKSKATKIEKIHRQIKMMKAEVERKKVDLIEKEREISRLEDFTEDAEKKVQALEEKRNAHRRELKQISIDFKLARLECKVVLHEREMEIGEVKTQIDDLQAKTNAQVLPKTKKRGVLRYRKQLRRLFRRH